MKKLYFILLLTVLFPAISYTQQFASAALIPYASSDEYDNGVVGNFYDEQDYIDDQDSVTLETFQYAIPAEDGQWVQVDPEEIDPDGYSSSDEQPIDENINTGYIWRPNNMGPDWNPYTNGYWEYTDYGWMWVSNYDWDATYHYGRWWYSNRYGWVWSPGYQWAPSWVSWRENDECAGWYPLSPRNDWDEGRHCYNTNNYHFIDNNWTFVEYQHFHSTVINHTIIFPPSGNHNLIGNTGTVTGVGPAVTKVEKKTGTKVTVINTVDIKKYPVNGKKTTTTTGVTKTDDTKKVNTNINNTKTGQVNNTGKTGVKTTDQNKITETNDKVNKTNPNDINNSEKTKTNTGKVKENISNGNSSKVTTPNKDTKLTLPKKETKKTESTTKENVTTPKTETKTYIPPVKKETYNPPPVKKETYNPPPVKKETYNPPPVKKETYNPPPEKKTEQKPPPPKVESPKVENPKTETKQDNQKGNENGKGN